MTISALEWVTRSSVDPAVFDRWPDYQVIWVAADHVDTTALAPIAERLHADAHAAVRSSGLAETDAHTTRWHEAFRDFGVKPRVARPSSDALVRRAVSEKGVPRINVLVDIYNSISIFHRVPIGGEDLDRYVGPARLILANGDEPFHTTSEGEATVEHAVVGEPVWVDDDGITCRRWNWRQTSRTAIHPETSRVGFIIDSLVAPDHLGATRAAEQLAALLKDPQVRVANRG